jgi:hypothetical protein
MSDDNRLPEIVAQLPLSEKYGLIRVVLPVPYEKFVSMEDIDINAEAVAAILLATREKVNEKIEQESITDFIKSNKSAIEAKRTEIGEDVIDEVAAAKILMKEREAVPSKPDLSALKSPSTTPAPAATPAPESAAGIIPKAPELGKKLVVWISAAYPGSFSLNCDAAVRDDIYNWLLSIPKTTRGRKTADPKKPDRADAIWNMNQKELDLLKGQADIQGIDIEMREGR